MIIETKKTRPAEEYTVRHKRCDLCGAEQGHHRVWPAKDTEYYRDAHHEITVSAITHFIGYEGDGAEKGITWDFCPACFEAKVRPLLETLAKPRKVDESW